MVVKLLRCPTREVRTDAGIDAGLVRRLIAAQFLRWSDLPVRPVEVDGWENRAYRLGEEMTVRLPTAAAYPPAVDGSDTEKAAVWDAALTARWTGPPMWFHGDVAIGNLLVEEGRLIEHGYHGPAVLDDRGRQDR
ncbi:MAG: hypothetical protein ACJ72W_16215 [Actinoallomurus sp.]